MARNMCTSRATPAHRSTLVGCSAQPQRPHARTWPCGTSIRSAGFFLLGSQETGAWPDVRHKANPAPANKTFALITRQAAGLPARRGRPSAIYTAQPFVIVLGRTSDWKACRSSSRISMPTNAEPVCLAQDIYLPKLRFRHHQEPSRSQHRS
jgi:hypothetical protein